MTAFSCLTSLSEQQLNLRNGISTVDGLDYDIDEFALSGIPVKGFFSNVKKSSFNLWTEGWSSGQSYCKSRCKIQSSFISCSWRLPIGDEVECG
jgi:hypothetical protein